MTSLRTLGSYSIMIAATGFILAGCWGGSSSTTETTATTPTATTASVEECAPFVAPVPALELDKTETFGAQDDAYSLSIPTTNKWEYQDAGDTVLLYNLDRSMDDKINLTINKSPNTGTVDIDQLNDGSEQGIKFHPNSKILEKCRTTINDMDARKIVWTGDQGQFPGVKSTQYVIRKGNVIIFTEFTATEKYYDQHVGTAQAIVESLEIK